MAGADGAVIIESKLNSQGFKAGLASLGGIAKGAVGGITAAIGAVGAGLAAAGGAAIKAGSDFEAGMSKVEAISGATGDELNQLTEKAKEMGAKTKFSATESASAFEYMAMAGWKTEDMLGGIEGVMNLAAASGEDLASVSDIVTDALTAFGMEAGESGHFADVLAAASSNANTNVGMMGATFKYVAPVAGAMGFSIEDTAAAIGLMANAGIKGEQAGTSLRAILTRLVKPPKDAAEALDALGISAANSDGSMKPLREIIGELRTKFDGLSQSEQASYAASIAGQEGMSGLLAIVNAAPEDFDKLTSAIDNADGSALKMAETMQDNLQGQITILKSALEGLGIEFYESIQEPLKDVVKQGIGYVNQLTEAFKSGGLDGLLESLGGIAADIITKAAQFAPTLINTAVTAIQSFISGLQNNLPAISKAAIDILSALINGIISIQPQIIDCGLQLITNLANGISQALPQLIPQIAESLTSIIQVLVQNFPQLLDSVVALLLGSLPVFVEAIGNLVASLTAALPEIITQITAVIPQLVQGIADALSQCIPIIVQGGVTLLSALVEAFPAVIDACANALPQIISAIVTALLDGLPMLLDAGVQLLSALAEAVPQAISAIVSVLPELITGIVNGIMACLPEIIQAGIDLLTALVDGLPDIINTIVSVLPDIVNSIVDGLVVCLPLLIQAGVDFFTSLVQDLPQIIQTIVAVLPELIDSIINGLLECLPLIIQAGIDLFVALIQALPEIIQTIVAALPQIIESIVSGLMKCLPQLVDAGVQLFLALIENLPTIIIEIVKAVPEIIAAIVKAFLEQGPKLIETGVNLIKGIGEGILKAASGLVDIVSGVVGGVVDFVKNLLGIHSPSTVFAEIGSNMAAGVGEGFADEMPGITNDMQGQIPTALDMNAQLEGEGIILPDLKTPVVQKSEEAVKGIEDVFQTLSARLQPSFNTTLQAAQKWLADMLSAGSSGAVNFVNSISTSLAPMPGNIQQVAGSVSNVVQQWFSQLISSASSQTAQFASVITSGLSGIPSQFNNIGRQMAQGLWDGMNSMRGWLQNQIHDFVNSTVAAAREAADIHSPSRLMADMVGAPLAEGVGMGFENTMPSLRAKFDAAANDIASRLAVPAANPAKTSTPTARDSSPITLIFNVENSSDRDIHQDAQTLWQEIEEIRKREVAGCL